MSSHADDTSSQDTRSWLCPTESDRARLLELSPGITQARRGIALAGGLGMVAIAPWWGWDAALIFLGAPLPLLCMDRWLTRSRRPERIAAGVQLLNLLLILAAVAVSGGARSPLLPWIAWPLTAAAARFRSRVFHVAVALTIVLTVGCLCLVSTHQLIHHPDLLIGVGVLLIGLVLLQRPVLDAEHRWRRDAVLDSLTGLLNRQGLDRRFAELAEQARLMDAPISLVLFDLDGFKAVNDTHGHARGDDVLTDVADTLRSQLRSFELLYRLGGDELLLLLPGADREAARGVAEQARLAVAASRPGSLELTVSVGVCTATGSEIRLAEMFAAADRSLYAAKRSGRNAVYEAPHAGAEDRLFAA